MIQNSNILVDPVQKKPRKSSNAAQKPATVEILKSHLIIQVALRIDDGADF
jgi:hypothetical protein